MKPMTAEDLLVGPRGARMCLEWAARCAREQPDDREAFGLDSALLDWELARAGSASTVVAFAIEEPEGMAGADILGALERKSPEPPDPGRIAGLVGAVRLREPDDREALELLAEVVAQACYWQPPDERDRVAALPQLRKPLRRAAEVIASAASTVWWTSPMERAGQWVQTFTEPGERPLWPGRPALAALKGWRARIPAEEARFEDWYRRDSRSLSGSWWSIEGFDLVSTTRALADGAPLGLWCVEDWMRPDRVLTQRIDTPGDVCVREIDGPADWADLCREHPVDVTWSRRGDWAECTGRAAGPWVLPDWAELAASGTDAVHLTVRGYLRCAGAALDVDGARASTVAGWDPDRTFWLRDVGPAGRIAEWEPDGSAPGLAWRRRG
ncbi:hypothetical protein ACFQ23_06805 [Schaalia naturae]|uniref:hypothetical protein n=1 Tax=Schaalia naturae TaxID=635203 RepID=UPI0036412B71